jgi:electron transport complex protein RnfB
MKRPPAAVVDESRCIGCTRCIDACPVDAIVGAQGLMHTVVEPWCIGCALCLPPCPVDCIDMVPRPSAWTESHRRAAGARGRKRKARLERERIVPAASDRRAVLDAILGKKR